MQSQSLVGMYFRDPRNHSWRWVSDSPNPGYLITVPVNSDGIPSDGPLKLSSFQDMRNFEFFDSDSYEFERQAAKAKEEAFWADEPVQADLAGMKAPTTVN